MPRAALDFDQTARREVRGHELDQRTYMLVQQATDEVVGVFDLRKAGQTKLE